MAAPAGRVRQEGGWQSRTWFFVLVFCCLIIVDMAASWLTDSNAVQFVMFAAWSMMVIWTVVRIYQRTLRESDKIQRAELGKRKAPLFAGCLLLGGISGG